MAADDIVKIRMKLADALRLGVIEEKSHGALQQVILQLVNEAERAAQSCDASIARLQEQIERTRGKKDGFAQVASIAYAVLDGLVTQTERASAEELRLREERAKAEDDIPAPLVPEITEAPKKRKR